MLTTKHLIRVYKWITAVAIVFWSYSLNESYVKYILESKERRSSGGEDYQDFSTASTTIYPEGIFYTFVTNYICQVMRGKEPYFPKQAIYCIVDNVILITYFLIAKISRC